MNRLTRLTALLLALMMILSTFAAADTRYQAGDMTLDQWNEIVTTAEDELFVIDEGDSGKEVTPELPEKPEQGPFYPYTDGTETDLIVSETGVTCQMTASGVAVLKNSTPGQWQIKIGDAWIGVTGETGEALWVTAAMMNGMTTADFRKALEPKDEQTGAYTAFTQTATVEIVEAVPAAFKLMARADENGGEDATPAEDSTTGGQLSLQAANPDLDKYYVVINYVFDATSTSGGMPAANPYTAEVSTNKLSFSATVKHPTVKGYAPASAVMKNNPDVEATEALPAGFVYSAENITITNVDLDGNVNIYVYYVPAENTFDVIYREELVEYTIDAAGNDVKYAKVSEKEYTGITEAPVKNSYGDKTVEQWFATLHTPEGFRPLLYDDEIAIAADGTTEVNVYYQRLYYLMAFDLGGGYGVNPIYTKHGAEIGEVGTPTRPGYEFMGWTLDPDATEYTEGQTFAEIPELMPIGNSQYYAVWKPVDLAKVSVVIWGENANDEDYAYQKTIEFYAMPDSTINFTTGNVVCGYTNHTHNANCYDCGTPEHIHGPACCTIEVHEHDEACCTIEVHAHNQDCYTNVGAIADPYNAPQNPVDGQIYVLQTWVGTYRYIYINGIWYRYTATANNNAIINANCGQTAGSHDDHTCVYCDKDEHAHTDGDCVYCSENLEEHAHTAECLSCTLKEHTHTTSCYITDPNMDSKLWKLVKSEPVKVAADGSTVMEVFYDRVDKTLTFHYDYNTRTERYGTTKTITAKWGEDISDEFTAITDDAGSSFWATSNGGDQYMNYVGVMPQEDDEFWNRGATGSNGTMTYYGQKLEGTGYDVIFTVSGVGGYTVTKEDRYEFEGFTYERGTANGQSCSGATFYYSRNDYDLVFNNGVSNVHTAEELFEAPLGKYASYKLTSEDAPSQYEPGAVYFDGWYLNPECSDDARVEFTDEITMPAENIIVYAKWSPYLYDVRVYTTQEAAEQARADVAATGTTNVEHIYQWVDKSEHVKHGKPVSSAFTYSDPNQYDDKTKDFPKPTRPGYTFALWYYFAPDGTMQPFSFTATPITQDTFVFAVWDSDSIANYTIYYVLEDGQEGAVAEDYYLNEANWVTDPYVGRGLAGANVTERAKGGDQLYDGTDNATGNTDYREGYFPTSESHSFFLNVEDENTKNVWVFEYVQEDEMPYTVYYVTLEDPQNGLDTVTIDGVEYFQVAEPFTDPDNRKAVVTENYKPVSGNYVPDAFQKRLIITAGMDATDRVIVFYYDKDESRTTLEVNHWLVHADGSQNTPYDSEKRIVDLNPTFTETLQALTIPNYTYAASQTTRTDGDNAPVKIDNLTITISQGSEGVIVDMYYVEDKVNITYVAVGPTDAENYGAVSPDAETNIGVVTGNPTGSTATAHENYHFEAWYRDAACTDFVTADTHVTPEKTDGVYTAATYYAKFVENEVTIKYLAVGPEGATDFGTVNPTGETVRVLTGTAVGSTATPNAPTFKFVGWYDNAACNGIALSTDVHYVPTKANGAWVDGTTYYAKFDWNVADLTITKTVAKSASGATAPADDKFTIQVKLTPANGAKLDEKYSYTKTNGTTVTEDELTVSGDVLTLSEVKDGDVIVIKGIVIGTGYKVSETAKPDYYIATYTGADGTVVAPTTDSVNRVGVTNTYQTGHLTITKTVTGVDADDISTDAVYTFTVKNSDGGVVDTISLAHGQSKTISNLPIGDYTVTEGTPANIADYTFVKVQANGADSDSASVKVIDNDTVTVPYTNVYKKNTASLTVEKTVVASTAGTTAPADDEFRIKITFTAKANSAYGLPTTYKLNNGEPLTLTNGAVELPVKAGDKITFPEVVIDTQYTVEEISKDGYYEVSYANAAGTIAADATATVTNTYKTGSLTISKTVEGDTAPDDTFTFELDLSSKHATYSYSKTAADGTTTNDTVAYNGTVKLKAGESVTIMGIPAGTDYTVTETHDDDYITTPAHATGKIKKDSTVEAAFTNTYQRGDLTITKTVVNNTGVDRSGDAFEFTITLNDTSINGTYGPVTFTNGIGKTTLKEGESVTIKDLPKNVGYTVTEADVLGYADESTGATGTIEAGKVSTAAFTNTYEVVELKITKKVVGDTAPADDTFNFTVTLTDTITNAKLTGSVKYSIDGGEAQTANLENGAFQLTLQKGQTATIAKLPKGVTYAVVEATEAYYTTEYDSMQNGTITKDSVSTTVTNTYLRGDLTISKRVEPYDELPRNQFKFTLELSDQSEYAYVITKHDNTTVAGTVSNGKCTFELEEDWYITVKDIPNGTGFTVTEELKTGYATYASADGTIDKATDNTNSVTDTIVAGTVKPVVFENVYGLGTLQVRKDVVGTNRDDTFEFRVTVTDKDGNYLVGVFPLLITYDEAGTPVEKVVNVSTEFSFELKGGWSARIARLPEGTRYTIQEVTNSAYDTWVDTSTISTNDAEANYGTKTNVVNGLIPADGMNDIIFTNVYRYSTLTIKKTGMETGESAIFEVKAYSKYNNDQKTTFTVSVPNGGEVTIGELLIGSDYTITEIGSWSNRYAVAKPVTGMIDENGSVVTITNTDKNNQWLHDEDYVHNDFSKPGNYPNN